jgi:hypothetical protein
MTSVYRHQNNLHPSYHAPRASPNTPNAGQHHKFCQIAYGDLILLYCREEHTKRLRSISASRSPAASLPMAV